MNLNFKRVAALGASAALAAGGLAVVGASSASAAVLNTYLGNISTQGTSGPGTGGTTADNFNFTTVNPCPANDGAGTNTNNFRMIMNGPNWSNITIVGNTTAGVSHSGAQTFPIADNFNGLASANGLPAPSGTYLLTGFCQNSSGSAVSGKFYTQLVFTGSNFTVSPIPEEATTTSLTAAPPSMLAGASVTLSAHVAKTAPPGVATLAGSVQFKDGAANFGAPVAINGTGDAQLIAPIATVGTHPFTAVFTADNTANVIPAAQVLGSTSSPAQNVVVSAPATSTTTVISAPTNGFINTPITVTATVTPGDSVHGAPVGKVSFTDNGNPVAACSGANAVSVSGNPGLASCVVQYAAPGAHAFTGSFTPTDPTAFGASSGNTVSTDVASVIPTRVATEFIRVTVPAGALTLTVQGYVAQSPTTPDKGGAPLPVDPLAAPNSPAYPYTVAGTWDANGNDITDGHSSGQPAGAPLTAASTNVVILPKAALNPAGTLIVSSGNMIPVVSTDTRSGDLPYNVTGSLLGDFQGTNAANVIDGRNLGWDPIFISSTRFAGHAVDSIGNGATVTWTDAFARTSDITNGALVAPANGIHTTEATIGGLDGLKHSGNNPDGTPPTYPTGTRTLFSTTHGAGTFFWGAKLTLQAPTDTQPDTYQATLQLTANGTGL